MNSKPEPRPLDEIMAEYDAELIEKANNPKHWTDNYETTHAGTLRSLGDMLDEDDAERLAKYREELANS